MSGTPRTEVTVWCNHPDCEVTFDSIQPDSVPDEQAFEAAATEAERFGWQTDHRQHGADSLDYCPMHHVQETSHA